MHWLLRGLVGILVLLTLACSQVPAAQPPAFVTEHGLGPDKWATAWLLTRRAVPDAKLVVVDAGQALPDGIDFDTPSSSLRRIGNRAAFEVAQTTFGIDDPDVERLAQIIHDIEVDYWGPVKAAEAPLVEQAFRTLQRGQLHSNVTPACYIAFFDGVYNALRAQRMQGTPLSLEALPLDCGSSLAAGQENRLVPEVSIPGLLAEMKRGKSVVFVDVREADEFAGAHIPGALNITLRELDQSVISRVEHADYVVSYCVKDFRGFEMARAFRDAGVDNAVILKPYGLRGWVSHQLPLAGTEALAEVVATNRLVGCIEAGSCANATETF